MISQGAVSLKKTHTHTTYPRTGRSRTTLQVCTYIHALKHLCMQPVCCSGTTSAVRAILPSQHCYFLPFNISCPLSTFIHSSPIFPFIPLILRHPHPTPIHPHHLFSPVSVSLPPLLPPEAGDVEWCSAVSDYQALLCEWNDNHRAALQRERRKRGGEGVGDREKKEGKGACKGRQVRQ